MFENGPELSIQRIATHPLEVYSHACGDTRNTEVYVYSVKGEEADTFMPVGRGDVVAYVFDGCEGLEEGTTEVYLGVLTLRDEVEEGDVETRTLSNLLDGLGGLTREKLLTDNDGALNLRPSIPPQLHAQAIAGFLRLHGGLYDAEVTLVDDIEAQAGLPPDPHNDTQTD